MAEGKSGKIRSPEERAQYVKNVKEQKVEPTSEEGLNFDQSYDSEPKDELGTEDHEHLVTPGSGTLIWRHLRENGIYYLLSLLVLLLSYFANEARINLTDHNNRISNNKEDIIENEEDIDELRKTNNEQEVDISVNKSRIDNLEREDN